MPMVRYTYPLPYGMSVAVAAEQPNVDFSGPFGQFGTDTNQILVWVREMEKLQQAGLAA